MVGVADYLDVLDTMIERHEVLLEHVIPEDDEEAREDCAYEIAVMQQLREKIQEAWSSVTIVRVH